MNPKIETYIQMMDRLAGEDVTNEVLFSQAMEIWDSFNKEEKAEANKLIDAKVWDENGGRPISPDFLGQWKAE